MSVPRRIVAFLDLASQDADAAPLETYLPFAAAYRYPTPGGRIVAAPDMAQVSVDADAIDALIKEARAELK